MQWSDYFELWKSYEDIAKHFNELIIRNRLQALGGLAATVAIVVGFFTQKAITHEDNVIAWKGLGFIFIFLAVFWAALFALDVGYYNQLLQGSVVAIIALEKAPEAEALLPNIDLSTKIQEAVWVWEKSFGDSTYNVGYGIFAFYGLVFLALIISVFVCFWPRKKPKSPNS